MRVGNDTYYSEEDDFSICEYAAYQLGKAPENAKDSIRKYGFTVAN